MNQGVKQSLEAGKKQKQQILQKGMHTRPHLYINP